MRNIGPSISTIIISYNVRDLLAGCLQSLLATCGDLDLDVHVTDNASCDGSVEMVRQQFPQVRLLANHENRGFAAANNQAFKITKGEYLLLLNPDTMLKPGAIKNVLEFMLRTPDCGLAGCRILNPDGTLQRSILAFPSITERLLTALYLDIVFLPSRWWRTHYRKRPFEIDCPLGAFMMIRRSALPDGFLLDPGYFMYAEELDLALRMRSNGYKAYFVPNTEIVHIGEQSTSTNEAGMYLQLQKSMRRLYESHYRGLYKYLLVFCQWLILLSRALTAIIAAPFIGFQRFRLFYSVLVQYPWSAPHSSHP